MAGFKGMKKFIDNVQKKKDKVLHDVTNRAFYNLVTGSPVDIGNFRGSWFGSFVTPRIGNPTSLPYTENLGVEKGTPPTSDEIANIADALRAQFGQDVFITNNLSYAQPLENGYSKQAPGGILYVNAQKTRAQIGQ